MNLQREEYLTSIHRIIEQNGFASNKLIANELNISPASVSEMLKKLKNEGLIELDRQNILLSEEGKSLAENILSKHRLWEIFLEDRLGFSWLEVHDRARLLQAVTDDELMLKLNEFLSCPPSCPHGGVIFLNKHDERPHFPLSQAEINQRLSLKRINDEHELLNYIERKGLSLNCEMTVLERDDFDDSLTVELNGKKISISAKAANNLLVEKA